MSKSVETSRQRDRATFQSAPIDLTLSLPRRIIAHFETRAVELGFQLYERNKLAIDFIKQFCVHVLEEKPDMLDLLSRTPRYSAYRVTLYLGGEPELRRALGLLAKRYDTTPTTVARAAFFAFDSGDTRFGFRPLKHKDKTVRNKAVNVFVTQEVKNALLGTARAHAASSVYREAIDAWIVAGPTLPSQAELAKATGHVQIGFKLSTDEDRALRACAKEYRASVSDIIRAAFLRASQS